MSDVAAQDWSSLSERWYALALTYYESLPESKCDELIEETLQAITNHNPPQGAEESRGDSSGWRDTVHLDVDERYVHFVARKTLPQSDTSMEQLAGHKWSHYTDGDAFKKAHLGDNCEFFHQVLQRISPDAMIIQRVERYPDLAELTHSLALVFRVKTDTGYLLVFRCIESPQLQGMMKTDGLTLCGTFTWETFDVVPDESDSVLFTTTGSIGSDSTAYAKRWHRELLNALVLYETDLKDTTLVSNEAVAAEGSGVTNTSRVVPTVSQDACCAIL